MKKMVQKQEIAGIFIWFLDKHNHNIHDTGEFFNLLILWK